MERLFPVKTDKKYHKMVAFSIWLMEQLKDVKKVHVDEGLYCALNEWLIVQKQIEPNLMYEVVTCCKCGKNWINTDTWQNWECSCVTEENKVI